MFICTQLYSRIQFFSRLISVCPFRLLLVFTFFILYANKLVFCIMFYFPGPKIKRISIQLLQFDGYAAMCAKMEKPYSLHLHTTFDGNLAGWTRMMWHYHKVPLRHCMCLPCWSPLLFSYAKSVALQSICFEIYFSSLRVPTLSIYHAN